MEVATAAWQERLQFLLVALAKASDPAQMFSLQQDIKAAEAMLAKLATPAAPDPPPGPIYFNEHFPKGAHHFLGRRAELKALDSAWKDAAIPVLTLIAPGGTGKTALVLRWLEGMRNEAWRGAERVFGWSFYSQGTREAGEASEDIFLARALAHFRVNHDPALHAADKGRLLAHALMQQPSLLILDGVEPLQYPPGPLAGRLRAPGLETLLRQLALAGRAGLCVITSRERLEDLSDSERGPRRKNGSVLYRNLGNLGTIDGARLLHAQGAVRAGRVPIRPNDDELKAAADAVSSHALTLALLGRYLAKAHGGDIRKYRQVRFARADQDGHAFKVMAAYEKWLAAAGAESARELAALRLLGYFDRPANRDSLAALRAAPAIEGLTEPLQGQDEEAWATTLAALADCGLADVDEESGSVDAHPLVREYLAAAMKEGQPEAWREGHRRIYEQLKASAPHRPEGLAGLQPLYQAVAHGCWAGLWQEAFDEVYWDRILRSGESGTFYSPNTTGAFGADLGAVACYFVEPWRRLAPGLNESDQAWLLNEAAFSLRALGRLEEALEPMRVVADRDVKLEDWNNAGISYGSLSELQLSLGCVAAAVGDARLAVDYADRCGDDFVRMACRTTLADALHQQGATALDLFVKAEAMQVRHQLEYPLLYSLQGFQYCDLLLTAAERAAWRGSGEAALAGRCAEVAERTAQTLEWVEENDSPPLNIALDHLSLARCTFYTNRLQGGPPGEIARTETDLAVAGLRAASTMDHLPRGLLTRAWLRHACGDLTGAQADLDEAHQIAARGGMRLHLADIALTRARLFQDRNQLAEARRLIEACGYGRRLGELEDAEAAASG